MQPLSRSYIRQRLLLTVAVLTTFSSVAAQNRTQVRDTLVNADGSRVSGQVEISWNAFTSSDSKTVAGGKLVKRVTDGVLDVSLVPNEGAAPAGTSYNVNYLLTNGASYQETWVVPATGPVTVAAVRTSLAPSPTAVISQSQLVLGNGLKTLLGLWRQTPVTRPAATVPGQCYFDTSVNQVQCSDNGLNYVAPPPGGSASGDLAGSYPGPTVGRASTTSFDIGTTNKGTFTTSALSATRTYTLPDSSGTLTVTPAPLTTGSVLFAASGGQLSQDNSRFFFDDPTDALKVGPRAGFDPNYGGFYLPRSFNVLSQLNSASATTDTLLLLEQEDNTTFGNYGLLSDVVGSHTSGTKLFMTGITSQLANANAGSVTTQRAGYFTATNDGAGNVTDQHAIEAVNALFGAGNVANSVGLRVGSAIDGGAGAITNNYGIKVENQTAGANNWALKTGTGKVEFGDEVTAKKINAVRFADQFPGADIGAKINAAIADLPVDYGSTRNGLVYVPSGQYSFSTTINVDSPGVSIIGNGPHATVLTYTGTGDAFRIRTSPFSIRQAGKLEGIRLVGNANANAVAIHLGDIVGFSIRDVAVADFTGANSTCLWMDNVTNWTERTQVSAVHLDNCTRAVRFTKQVGAVSNSFGYQRFLDLRLNVNAGQTGFVSENDSLIYNSTIIATINEGAGAAAALISAQGASAWSGNVYDIVAEDTGGGGGTGFSVAAGAFFEGTGYVRLDGFTHSISGTVRHQLFAFGRQRNIQVYSIPLDANQGSVQHYDDTAMAAGVGGFISLGGKYTASGMFADWAGIKGVKENGTDGNFAGALTFHTRANGAGMAEVGRFSSSGVFSAGIFSSTAADPADTGTVRLGNAETIAWEASPAGTDITLAANANEVLESSAPISATTGFQIGGAAASGNVLRGNGTHFVSAQLGFADLNGSASKPQLPASAAYEDEANIFSLVQRIDIGATASQGLLLDMTQPGSAGQRDSHWIEWTGTSNDGSGHDADWRAFVDVSSNAAASTWSLQSRIDAAAFTNRLTVSDGGIVTANAFAGSLNGNATTATALAANGTNCAANNFAVGVDVAGVAECAQPAFSNLTGSASDAQVPDNVTIATLDTTFKLQDNADTSKRATFQLSGITTGTTRTVTVAGGGDSVTVRAAACSGTDKVSAIGADGAVTCSADQSGGGANHNLLSATHSDTTAATVARGDLLAGIGDTATWQRLGIGTANRVLASDGTDASWTVLAKTHLPSAVTFEDEANVFATAGGLTLDNQLGLRLREADVNGDEYIEHRAAGAITTSATYTWPAPAAGFLRADTSGGLTWNTAAGTGACGANAFVSALNDNAAPGCTQPSSTNLSDAANLAKLDAAQTFANAQTINPGVSASNGLVFDMAQPSSAGQRDSHILQMRGTSFDTAGHNADWRCQVDVTSNAGASQMACQSRIDAAAFATRFLVTDAGTAIATGNLITYSGTANNLVLDHAVTADRVQTLQDITDTFVYRSTTDTLTNKTIDAEAAGNTVTMPSKIYLPAGGCDNVSSAAGWDLPTSGAMGKACLGTAVRFGVLTAADASTTAAYTHLRLANDWTGVVDAALLYTGDTSSTNNIRWQVSTACVADSEDLLSPTFNTASAANSGGPTTARQRKSVSLSGINVSNCAAGETLFLRVERIGADAGDTYAGVAELFGVELTLRRAM